MKYFGIIYMTINLINSKIYIGQTVVNTYNDDYFGSGLYLGNAIKKYGKESFSRRTMCWCESQKELNRLEPYYIKFLDATNHNVGYNIAKHASHFNSYSGRTEQKISKSRMGMKVSEETKRKISRSLKNSAKFQKSMQSKEFKQRISNLHSGKILSRETKNKISDNRRGKCCGDSNPSKRKEVREKIRQQKLGKKRSEETKRKVSNALKGRKLPEEVKKKISKKLKGRIPWNKGLKKK